jgi:hypothetical protein
MIRTTVYIVAGFALAAAVAQGTAAGADCEDTRYTFNRADEGYLRLDGRTGQVSVCVRKPVGWACQMVPDERVALEAEIARLQGENVALKRELVTRNIPLPGLLKPEPTPSAKPDEPRLHPPRDADFDKVMNFVEQVWRRLVEMIVTLQKDILRRT